MKRLVHIPLIIGLFVLVAMLIVAGCGEEETTTTAAQQINCDPDAPSILPPTQGRPMLVEFFRDT